ncbi:MAG: YchJ family metal-binding protein [Polyangiaceae bacterium]
MARGELAHRRRACTVPGVKKSSGKRSSCPCHSGLNYGECCAPRHDGSRPAETPEALMRARFSAFATGLGDYLVDTLSSSHGDRALDRAALVLALSRAKQTQRFLGLEIRGTHVDGDRGEVLFHARIFERGVDRSFTERSSFAKEDGAWRYVDGEVDDGSGPADRRPVLSVADDAGDE